MKITTNRIKLNNSEQKELFLKLTNKIGSLKNLSAKMNVPYSTIKGYASEHVLLPEDIFDKALKLLNIKRERIIFEVISPNWGQKIGGRRGIESLLKKYPDKLVQWRKLANKNSVITNRKRIRIPKLNEDLAEFIGVYLGDGTLTEYFVSITGDSRYDITYFNYLSNLIKKLFNLNAKIRKSKRGNALILVVHSVELCSLLKNYGFNYGDKIRNNSLIPRSIMHDDKLAKACLRGLIDTDGCVAKHTNKLCIRFFSGNHYLLNQVYDVGRRFNLFTFRTGNQIGITQDEKVGEYFRVVGSSNLRHIVKFLVWKDSALFIYQKDLLKYYKYKKYLNINFPFKYKVLSASG